MSSPLIGENGQSPLGLGAVTSTHTAGVARFVAAVIACTATAYGLATGIEPSVLLGLLAVTAFFVFRVFLSPPILLRRHERGISSIGLTGTKQIRTDELSGFRYASETGHITSSSGPLKQFAIIRFEFDSESGARIQYQSAVESEWQELALTQWAINSVLERMAAKMTQGVSVDWTPTMRIADTAIEFRVDPQDPWSRFPLTEFRKDQDYYFADTSFCLGSKDQRPLHTERIDTRNFFPGYYLLSEKYAAERESTEIPRFAWGRESSGVVGWLYSIAGTWW